MIPRLGDGNASPPLGDVVVLLSLENDSPSRGRKRAKLAEMLRGSHKV